MFTTLGFIALTAKTAATITTIAEIAGGTGTLLIAMQPLADIIHRKKKEKSNKERKKA